MKTASLFPAEAKSRFMKVTYDRHTNMVRRLAKRNIPVPFTLAQLRDHLYRMMGDRYDGIFRCPYCGRVCDITEIELDHETPLERGGSPGLHNIGAPCAPCNQAKCEATAAEFVLFMDFLEREMPLARTSFLHRLSTWGKLVAGKRKAEMLNRNGGKMPGRKPQPTKPPLVLAAEEDF